MPETSRRRVLRRTAVVTVALLVAATGTTAAARKQPPVADLRADVNQDGRVDVAGSSDEAGEEAWRPRRGAVFLANVDDDSRRCRMRPGDLDRVDPAVDERLAPAMTRRTSGSTGCGTRRISHRCASRRSRSATRGGRVEVPAAQRPYVRLFVRRDGALRALRGPLTARELRAGVELALEGRDIVRDPRRWDGEVTVTLTVTDRGRSTSDRVRLKVAPVLFQHDLQRAERIFAAKPGPGLGIPPGPWSVGSGYRPREWRPFASSLVRAAGAAGLSGRDVTFTAGTEQWWRDIWRQDMVEPAVASVPALGGGVHSMRVLLRAPVLWAPPEGGEATLSRSRAAALP
ncbi:protein-arginine deiminase family protein [Streptomyces coeruleorubidus]|uniref:protein-arginine deiminase family protein n=1 Tax=Streptomyces coeruleorubidus TaxID=116188 RepID=UPI00237F529F|nr:protein-arginine deiminase family protein [Streptomyces coeruleorubidus]WDV49109.1 protein-arginine deiminase family protein [Streptomyces coeruleorubidus]